MLPGSDHPAQFFSVTSVHVSWIPRTFLCELSKTSLYIGGWMWNDSLYLQHCVCHQPLHHCLHSAILQVVGWEVQRVKPMRAGQHLSCMNIWSKHLVAPCNKKANNKMPFVAVDHVRMCAKCDNPCWCCLKGLAPQQVIVIPAFPGPLIASYWDAMLVADHDHGNAHTAWQWSAMLWISYTSMTVVAAALLFLQTLIRATTLTVITKRLRQRVTYIYTNTRCLVEGCEHYAGNSGWIMTYFTTFCTVQPTGSECGNLACTKI